MRKRVTFRKRKKVFAFAFVICVVAIIFLAYHLHELTRSMLNNDDIRANVEIVSAKLYDAEAMSHLFDFTPDESLSIGSSKGELCVAELRYSFYNHSGADVDNYSAILNSIEDGYSVYACSEMEKYSESDRIFVGTQYIILDKELVKKSYFTLPEPSDFKAPVKIEISYDKEDEIGRKTLSFVVKEKKKQ